MAVPFSCCLSIFQCCCTFLLMLYLYFQCCCTFLILPLYFLVLLYLSPAVSLFFSAVVPFSCCFSIFQCCCTLLMLSVNFVVFLYLSPAVYLCCSAVVPFSCCLSLLQCCCTFLQLSNAASAQPSSPLHNLIYYRSLQYS